MKVTDIYPATEYLKASDLQRPVKVRIASATVRTFTDQKTQEEQRKIVLSFEKATKVMTLNKTQGLSVAAAVGSDEIEHWPGKEIILSAGIAHNGQGTIIVSPVVTAPADEDNPFNS